MKAVLKELAIVALFLAGWYVLLFIASCILYPSGGTIDTNIADRTVFQTPERLIALEMPGLAASDKKKLFLIGGSNLTLGFRPNELQQYLPNYEVHNLGRGNLNVAQAIETVELIKLLPESSRKDAVIVLGVWYGFFVDHKGRWGPVPQLIKEEERYGLYKVKDGLPQPILKMERLPYLVTMLRPFILLHGMADKIYFLTDDFKTFMHNLIRKKTFDLRVFNHSYHPPVDEAYKAMAMEMWGNFVDTPDQRLEESQFVSFLKLCRIVHDAGMRLVVVDLPIPQWHSSRSPYYIHYQDLKIPYLKDAVRIDDAHYINMQDLSSDGYFFDSAHPFPSITKKWSERLAGGVQ